MSHILPESLHSMSLYKFIINIIIIIEVQARLNHFLLQRHVTIHKLMHKGHLYYYCIVLVRMCHFGEGMGSAESTEVLSVIETKAWHQQHHM